MTALCIMCFFKESLKFGVLAYTVIFVLIGTALTTIGAIYKLTFDDLGRAVPENYVSLQLIPIFTIIVGGLVFVLAFVGCASIYVNNTNFLITYGGLLSAVFILQIAVGTFTFVEIQDREDLSENVNATLDNIFQKMEDTNFINLVQAELRCCGTHGPEFWNYTMDKPFPETCCKNEDCTDVHKEGCQTAVFDLFVEAARVTGISVFVFSAAQVAGAILTFCFVREVGQRKGYARSFYEE